MLSPGLKLLQSLSMLRAGALIKYAYRWGRTVWRGKYKAHRSQEIRKTSASGSTLAFPHRSKLDMGIIFLRDGTIAFYCHILSSPCARSPKSKKFWAPYLPLIRVSGEAAQRPGIHVANKISIWFGWTLKYAYTCSNSRKSSPQPSMLIMLI